MNVRIAFEPRFRNLFFYFFGVTLAFAAIFLLVPMGVGVAGAFISEIVCLVAIYETWKTNRRIGALILSLWLLGWLLAIGGTIRYYREDNSSQEFWTTAGNVLGFIAYALVWWRAYWTKPNLVPKDQRG